MRLRRGIAAAMVVLLVMTASLGVAYGLWAKTLIIHGPVAVGYTNADFVAADTDDPPGTNDPGYDKDVAECTATVMSEEEVAVVLDNAYPSYTCTFTTTIENRGTLPERREMLEFSVPPALTVEDLNDLFGVVLDPGEQDVERFSVHVEQWAEQGATYAFTIRKPFSLFVAGTPGFWRNWSSNNTYTQEQIEVWLNQIDAASAWLGPTTTGGMEDYFDIHGRGGFAMMRRFLGHCLATNLDERSGVLDPTRTHDLTGRDPDNYLEPTDPTSATLPEIIEAIEDKYGTGPSNDDFETMKDVCDALNNLDI